LKRLSVESLDDVFSGRSFREFDKREPAGTPRFAVDWHDDV
jgi:hypothetical protein